MNAMDSLELICLAMAHPSFYPHAVSRVERRDTHISCVFLTGGWVYKIKKPVNFGFLNFESLEARKLYCHREVVLNQRLSRNVYEGVIGITREGERGFAMEGAGETVEYAVKMKELPDEANLAMLLAGGAVAAPDMEKLGGRLADFYEGSARNVEIDHYGHPEVIALNMEENFRQVEPFGGEFVDNEEWEFIRQASRSFFVSRRSLFEKRIARGRIRDGHGDLRCEHVYLHDGIQIIDCIEFNDRFRYGDVVCDLAFLHMDMAHLGRADLSEVLLAAYAERADDPSLYALLDFYATYRAAVKVKVACLRSTEVESEAQREELKAAARGYASDAYRYAVQFSRPTLWVFCGLPASGKSTLAERMADAMDLPLIQSDRIRKGGVWPMHVEQGEAPYDRGIYRKDLRHRVYSQMLALAQENLKSGRSVVLDATFSTARWRGEAERLGNDLDCNIIFVECAAVVETLRERLKAREGMPGISDARLQHLDEMVRAFEPLREIHKEAHLRISTDLPFDRCFKEILSKGYAMKCAQIDRLLDGQGPR